MNPQLSGGTKKLDIAKVRAAGYSDDQIKKFFDMNPDITPYDSTQNTAINTPENDTASWADWLPLAGSIAGSFIPGLGTIAGGAAGAGLGAIAKQFLDKKEGFDTGEVVKETALGGLGGIMAKGIGTVAGKVVPSFAKASSGFDDLARGMEQGTRQIKMPASIFGADAEKAINNTLTKYGFMGSAESQYANLKPVMKSIEGQIDDFIKANPGITVLKEDIKKSFFNNLKTSIRTRNLTQKQAISEVNGYLQDLLKASGGKGQFKEIPLDKLRQLKKLVNADFKTVASKLEKGTTPLNPREQVILAAWDSLDNAITKAAPTVKDLLRDESNLYKAAKSLSAARFNPPTFRVAGTSVPAWATTAGREAVKNTAREISKGLGKVPPGFIGPTLEQAGGQAGARMLFSEEMSNKQNQNYDTNNIYNHNDIIPSTTLGAVPQLQQEQKSITGYTPEKLYEGYIKAMQSGDTESAKALKQMYDDELKYQKETNKSGKSFTSGQLKELSDIQNSIDLMNTLDPLVLNNKELFGPIRGQMGRNPYATESKALEAQFRTAAQLVGKAMEGGVLRKEDEEKYRKMLPQITDTPEVAMAKIESVRRMVEMQLNTKKSFYTNYGVTPEFTTGLGETPPQL